MLICVCKESDLFITLLAVREHTPHVEVMVQLCSCQPDFHSDVLFCLMPHQVKYTSEGQLDFYMTVLLWAIYCLHGMAKKEAKKITLEHFKHSSDGLVKPFHMLWSACIMSHLSLLATATAWGLECIFCRNSPLFSRRWTSLWHFRWQFPCVWANLHLTPVP